MKFMQIIRYRTSRFDEVNKAMDEFIDRSAGQRASGQGLAGRDRDNPGAYVSVILFDSYEEAMRNSELPVTQEFAKRMGELCDGEPTFTNLDVVREDRIPR